MYNNDKSVSVYHRYVCNRCKQNEMKTIMKNYLGGCRKQIIKHIFDHTRVFS